MTGGTISGNRATGTTSNTRIGGGICSPIIPYYNLNLSESVIFHSNFAEDGAIIPPSNALILHPNIATTSSSIYDHPLNNYDINTAGPYLLTWNVTERYVDENGDAIADERMSYVLQDTPTYSKNHPAIAGYVPVGYFIGAQFTGGTYYPGTPAIIDPVSSDQIVYFVYEEGYTITEKYVDVNGDPINPPGTSATDVLQSSGMYSNTIPTLSGYGVFGWMWEADYLLLSGSDFPITTTTSGFNAGSPSSVAVSDDGTVYFVYAAVLEKVPGQGSGFGNATIVNQQGSSSQPEQGRQQESESDSGSESGSGIKEQQPAGGSETMPGTDYLWLSVILIFLAAIGFFFFFFLWKRRKDDKEKT